MCANNVSRYYFKRHAKRAASSKARSATNATPRPLTDDDCLDLLQDSNSPSRPIPQISDFTLLRTIHTSNRCTVTQVVKCSNMSELFALKTFSKNVVRRRSFFAGVMTELDAYKRIASTRDSKFLNKAFAAFQDTDNLYLLLVSCTILSCHYVFPHTPVCSLSNRRFSRMGLASFLPPSLQTSFFRLYILFSPNPLTELIIDFIHRPQAFPTSTPLA